MIDQQIYSLVYYNKFNFGKSESSFLINLFSDKFLLFTDAFMKVCHEDRKREAFKFTAIL